MSNLNPPPAEPEAKDAQEEPTAPTTKAGGNSPPELARDLGKALIRGCVRGWRAWWAMGLRRWRRRKWLLLGLAASGLGLAMALWVSVYLWTANYIDERVQELLASATATGWQISYETIKNGGFPLLVSRRFINLQAEHEGLFRLTSPDPEVRLSIADPSQGRILWSAARLEGVRFGVGGFDFVTGKSELDLHQPPYEGATEITLTLRDFAVVPPSTEAEALPALTAKVLTANLSGALPEEAHTVAFAFGAEGVLGGGSTNPRDFSLAGRLFGLLPGGEASVWLAAWRDNGGYVELDSVEFASGAATITANGSLTLDRENYPLGTGRFIFSGGPDLLGSLGMTKPNPSAEGEEENIELEFSWRAQNGKLHINDIPIFQLRALF